MPPSSTQEPGAPRRKEAGVNKAELVQAVADRAGSSPAEARRHVDALLEEIVTGVADGERISLVGFGTFDSAARAARTARNPRTGATIDVPAAVVPRFRMGAGFKARVADGDGAARSATVATAPRAKAARPAKSAAVKDSKDSKKDSKKDAKKSGKKDGKKSGKAKKSGKKK